VRRALAIPIVLPLLIAPSGFLVAILPNDLTGVIFGIALILFYALLVYALPYLLFAIPLWVFAPRLTRREVVRCLWILPISVSVLAAVGVALIEMLDDSYAFGAGSGDVILLGLIFGYGYALVAWLYLSPRFRHSLDIRGNEF